MTCKVRGTNRANIVIAAYVLRGGSVNFVVSRAHPDFMDRTVSLVVIVGTMEYAIE